MATVPEEDPTGAVTRAREVLPTPGTFADAFVACVVLLVAVAIGFAGQAGRGRSIELAMIGAGVAAAYLLGWRIGRFVVLEYHYARLSQAHYWREVFVAAGICGASLAASYLRLTIETCNARLGRAAAEIGELRTQDTLAQKLRGARAATPLDVELERARRYNHCASLLIVQPDDLDDIAQHYGELGSTEVLGDVAEAIGRNIRAVDVSRLHDPFGFVVILPEATREAARVVAERIRLDVARRRLDFGPGEIVNLTVTIGAATFPEDALTNDELVAAAQSACVAGIKLGGNRTVLYSVPDDAPRGWALDRDVESVVDRTS